MAGGALEGLRFGDEILPGPVEIPFQPIEMITAC